MENIKSILISLIAPMENHIANGGEKLLGNASSIKRRPDGRVYISGQMQRHVLFSAINRLNLDDPAKGKTFVSNGDGVTSQVELDLRADMGGFLHTSRNNYSGRRTAPLSVTPAVAMKPSEVGRDLLIRIRQNAESDRDQALATREYSERDDMLMNFCLDVAALSISHRFTYESEFHLQTHYQKHVEELERKRRARLMIAATRSMNDFANQARNAVSGEPTQVLIVFDTKFSRKAARYFEAHDTERANILQELSARGAHYFIGDDSSEQSVDHAYRQALDLLNTSTLYDPAGGDKDIKSFANTFAPNAAS